MLQAAHERIGWQANYAVLGEAPASAELFGNVPVSGNPVVDTRLLCSFLLPMVSSNLLLHVRLTFVVESYKATSITTFVACVRTLQGFA
jgi:hypothetical protein